MLFRNLVIFLTLASAPLQAIPREWKSANGARSIMGEFVKRDASSVTIRRADQKEVTIPFQQLHPEERAWTDANHPLVKPNASTDPVFDNLMFGDTREEVAAKLKASKFVELTVAETFIGRTGLNGIFRTREKIGGLDAMLYFDWDDAGRLKEITVQTTAVPASKLNELLKPCWKEFTKLLTNLHGQPINASDSLVLSSIPNGGLVGTHVWKLKKTGSALLGAARDGNQYQIVIRFTLKNYDPVMIPAPSGG